MIVPSWLLECAISRPNQALVAAAEGAGQGGGRRFQLTLFGPRPFCSSGLTIWTTLMPRVGYSEILCLLIFCLGRPIQINQRDRMVTSTDSIRQCIFQIRQSTAIRSSPGLYLIVTGAETALLLAGILQNLCELG
jgi:hypothetical protein